jgi:hypothetical protein
MMTQAYQHPEPGADIAGYRHSATDLLPEAGETESRPCHGLKVEEEEEEREGGGEEEQDALDRRAHLCCSPTSRGGGGWTH